MREELGLIEDKNKRPLDTGIATFVGFNAIGIIPLIPFMFLYASDLKVSIQHIFNNIYCNLLFFNRRKSCR
jgi:vacuolar iron transporter family protein